MIRDDRELEGLPLSKTFRVALQGIRIRIWRAMVVVSSIILAIAFLSYILMSDSFASGAAEKASVELQERLAKAGLSDNSADQKVQTYWMVGLALLISFVGILNAMLMSVTERFREIGTMKCLGALDSFVLRLFLIESLLEGIGGTFIGIVIGAVLAIVEGSATYGSEIWALVPISRMAMLLGCCFAGGLILTVLGALYPARQAAKMRPVVALRAEL